MTEQQMHEAKMRVINNWPKYRDEWQRRFDEYVYYWERRGMNRADAVLKAIEVDGFRLAGLDSWNPTPEPARED